jgi:hypothetical protein
MASRYLEETDRLLRYVPHSRLRRDDTTQEVIGPLPAAFRLRPGEEYLSATWCEFFAGAPEQQVSCAIMAVRGSTLKVTRNSAFTLATVAAIKGAMATFKLRIIHEPESDNPAHAALRRWPESENDDLFQMIADDVWSETILNVSIPDAIDHECAAAQ